MGAVDTYLLLGKPKQPGFPDLSLQIYLKWIIAKISKRLDPEHQPIFRDESYDQRDNTIIDVFARQGTAFFGGLTLVVPLSMMTFLTTVKARLAIVCSFVFLFAICIGYLTNFSGQDAPAATAVLVVFVGTLSKP